MKSITHPNIYVFKVFVLYVDNNFNFYRTAQQLKRNRSNIYRMYRFFCNHFDSELTYVDKNTHRTCLTENGQIAYEQGKMIVKAYEQIEQCYK